jgi:hypothetical protein
MQYLSVFLYSCLITSVASHIQPRSFWRQPACAVWRQSQAILGQPCFFFSCQRTITFRNMPCGRRDQAPRQREPLSSQAPRLRGASHSFHSLNALTPQTSSWRRPGSNRLPPPCKGGALPDELLPRNTAKNNLGVGLGRVELPTSRLSGARSNHLSYRPKMKMHAICEKGTWRAGAAGPFTGAPHASSGMKSKFHKELQGEPPMAAGSLETRQQNTN